MRKSVALAAAGLALASGLTACGSGSDSGKGGGKDGTLVVGATPCRPARSWPTSRTTWPRRPD